MAKAMSTNETASFFIHLMIVLLCLSVVLPFLHILALAFNSGKDAVSGGIWFFPRDFSFSNFKEVFKQDNLISALLVSIFRTSIGTVAGVFLMSMAAWALSIPGLPFRSHITFFIFFTMLFSGGTIPYYLVLSKLKLTNSIWVYIIPGLYSVTNILLLRSAFKQLPMSVIEAARIDGMSELSIFFKMVLPMSKPTIATVSLFTAVGHWNDWFSGAFYVRNAKLKPLATILQDMLTRQERLSDILLGGLGTASYKQLEVIDVTSDSLQMATIIIVILPIVIMYPFIQKYFVKGITLGSVKG